MLILLLLAVVHTPLIAAMEAYNIYSLDPAADEAQYWAPPKMFVTSYVVDGAFMYGTGYYDGTLESKGWDVFTYKAASKEVLAQYPYSSWYAAGFVEGYSTYVRINQVYNSQSGPVSDTVSAFLDKMVAYMNDTTTYTNKTFDNQIKKQLVLMKGIADGYTRRYVFAGGSHTPLSFKKIFTMNIGNELGDIEGAVSVHEGKPVPHRTMMDEHCSALVKVTDTDIFFSQVTWSGYSTFIGRQYKTYMMETSVSMTTNAGIIASGDDWYITSNNLSTMETTNEFSNEALYKNITSQSTAEFMRVMAANFIATSAPEWAILYKTTPSGTYCNQWMVIDYNVYKIGQKREGLADDLFWVIEEIPGMVVAADQTAVLRNQTYWASYNIPYYRDIYVASGFQQQTDQYGDFFSYDRSPRAEIFRRDHVKVVDLKSMQAMMRYNDWQNDPLSTIPNCTYCRPTNSPLVAIASRGDLVSGQEGYFPNGYAPYFGRSPFGALDAKISGKEMMGNFVASVVQGPTHDQQPVFSWDALADDYPTIATAPGMPQDFDFTFKYWSPMGVWIKPIPPFDATRGKMIMAGVIAGSVSAVISAIFLIWFTKHRTPRRNATTSNKF